MPKRIIETESESDIAPIVKRNCNRRRFISESDTDDDDVPLARLLEMKRMRVKQNDDIPLVKLLKPNNKHLLLLDVPAANLRKCINVTPVGTPPSNSYVPPPTKRVLREAFDMYMKDLVIDDTSDSNYSDSDYTTMTSSSTPDTLSNNETLTPEDDWAFDPLMELTIGDYLEEFTEPETVVMDAMNKYIMDNAPTIAKILRVNASEDIRMGLYQDYLRYVDSDTLEMRLSNLITFKDNLCYIEQSSRLGLLCTDPDTVIDFLEQSCAPHDIKVAILKEYNRVRTLGADDQEKQTFYGWWHWVKRLPVHQKVTKPIETDIKTYIRNCTDILNNSLYGLDKVKTNVLALLRLRFLYPEKRTHPIGFIGSPGVGKTMIVTLIAKCEGKQLERLVTTDTNSLDGKNNVWLGATPGQPVMALCRTGAANCCILIDEVDKLDSSMLQSLLFLLDPDHNHRFVDNYIAHFPVDFSKVCFMLTSNSSNLHPALYDRVHWLNIPKYTLVERRNIITRHILPRINEELNTSMTIDESGLSVLLNSDEYTVRWVRSALKSIMMEKCLHIDMGKVDVSTCITGDEIYEYVKSTSTKDKVPDNMYT